MRGALVVGTPLSVFSQNAAQPVEEYIDGGPELRPFPFGEDLVGAIDGEQCLGVAGIACLGEDEVRRRQSRLEPFQPQEPALSTVDHSLGYFAVSLRDLNSHKGKVGQGILRANTFSRDGPTSVSHL